MTKGNEVKRMSNSKVNINTDFLTTLMKYKGLTEKEFADVIGVSYSMVNRVVNGKRGAGSKFINGILVAFPDVTYSQLITCVKPLPKGNKSKKTA